MLVGAPLPHGSDANLAVVGTLFEGFGRSVASPPLPRRLRVMGHTVQPSSSLSDNRFNSFSGRNQGFKPDLGNSAVRHYRGASENVAMAELRTHLATERVRVGTLRLKQTRPSSIPTHDLVKLFTFDIPPWCILPSD